MTRFLGRRYLADYIAGSYVLAYYAWLLLRTPGTPLTVRVGDFAFYPLGLAVGWACLANARRLAADRRTRSGWTFLGAQALFLWLIGISWPHLVTYFGPAAWPSWIGYLEILQHLLLVAGLLSFPGRPIGPDQRTRFRLDVGLVLVAGFVLAFHFGLRLTLTKPVVGPPFVAVAQSVLDWIVFAAAAVGVLHKRDATMRAVMGLQLAAGLLYLFGNYTLYGMDRYRLGDAVDGIWFAAWVFRWASARVAWHRHHAAVSGHPEASATRLDYQSSLFSYVMLAGAFLLLMTRILAGDRRFLWLLAVSSMLMAVLLMLRQVAELRENQRLYESRLAELTRGSELERQLHHAQKLDAIGHLAGGLAHDFNNVLTAIRGYAELLRDQVPSAAAAEDLAHIEQAVDRAATVTGKLLAFSRKQAVQTVVLDLNAVLGGLEPLLRQLLTDRIQVSLETDPALWRIKADQGQVEQVVINLTTNARDAMPDGGVLRIVTANRRIPAQPPDAAGPAPGDYVALIAIDQGQGMTDEVRQRIFEPFFSTKPKERGIGLGLAMVHGIVTQSGGYISVESQAGRGASFTILFPRTAARAAEERPEPADLTVASRTVLLVDDEFGVRSIARRLLERAGHRVVEAAGGAEALDLLAGVDGQRQPVDLLLTDMVMPGIHGRDLVARFRELRPGVPVICMTGFEGEHLDALTGEITAVVMKPFSADALLRAVAEACAGGTAKPAVDS